MNERKTNLCMLGLLRSVVRSLASELAGNRVKNTDSEPLKIARPLTRSLAPLTRLAPLTHSRYGSDQLEYGTSNLLLSHELESE